MNAIAFFILLTIRVIVPVAFLIALGEWVNRRKPGHLARM